MEVTSLTSVTPFTTKDGSTIRELHHTELQSLAEATLEPSQATEVDHLTDPRAVRPCNIGCVAFTR